MEFCDPYESIVHKNVFYVTENIPTAETEEKFQEVFSVGCDCESVCSRETNCSCIIKYGKSYIIKQIGAQNDSRDNIYTNYALSNEQNGIFECNSNCTCKHNICGNRLVQYGPRKYLEIRICKDKGLGLVTTKKITVGTFICEYAGEVITPQEATKREHFGSNITTTFIDPSGFGNIGRYLNHSCNPNCELVPVRVENSVPKLGIFAKMHIDENIELTFDYGDGNDNALDGDDLDLKECVCGETNCRKWMPYCTSIK